MQDRSPRPLSSRIVRPPAPERPGWPDVLLLLALAVAQVWGLGSYGLYEPHEAHFAGVGREMVLSGDWIVPHLNGSPYLNKPPLVYWLVALSQSLLGINEFAARLPLAFFAVAGCALAWQWAREVWGLAAGRLATGLLGTSAGWYLFSHQLMIDLPLAALHLLALYLFWKALQKPARTKRWVLFYAIVGAQVMAKGPVGLLFNAVLIGAWAVARRDAGFLLRCRPLLGMGVICAICLPWVAAVELRVPGVLSYMIVNENLKRAVDQRWPRDYGVVNVSPLSFLAATLIWLAPWGLLLPAVWARLREPASSGSERSARFVLAAGALIPTLLFLPMPSRLIYYCLPTVPPFAVLAAAWWAAAHEPARGRMRCALGAVFAVLGAAIASAAFWVPPLLAEVPDLAAAPLTIRNIFGMALLLGAGLGSCGALLVLGRTGRAALGIGVIALACAWNVRGFSDFDPVRSSKKIAAQLDTRTQREALWVYEGSKEIGAAAGLTYYLGTDAAGQTRVVLMMEDDERRPPPAFPPPKAAYLITQQELAAHWASPRPVFFVTDLQRQDWEADPPRLPAQAGAPLVLEHTGHRRVYANPVARARLGLE